MSNLKAIEYKTFEEIKHLSEDGHEFWYARELAVVLEYVQWRNFKKFWLGQFLPVKTVVTRYSIILLRSAKRSKCPKQYESRRYSSKERFEESRQNS
jgi:hypothetical protein